MTPTTRLYLVTPRQIDPATFADRLRDALAGGDVASVLLDFEARDEGTFADIARPLVGIGQAAGAAVLVRNDSRIAGRTGADGIHCDGDEETLRDALDRLSGRMIVGAGDYMGRDPAMLAGEAGADYVWFGTFDAPARGGIFPRTLELASWWAEIAPLTS